LGQSCVLISQDDKAKIPIGATAVGKTFKVVQSMNTAFHVPDHDFPAGAKHKFIPTFYLTLSGTGTMESEGKLACFVRPMLFAKSCSGSHVADVETMIKDHEISPYFLKADGAIRPIWFIMVDGGPDENPRYWKNIAQWCVFFRNHDIDYLSVRTHAPGQSAFNPVERAMCSYSGKLAGVVLPPFTNGNHLSSDMKTVSDVELARANMESAYLDLYGYWGDSTYKGKPLYMKYVKEDNIDDVDMVYNDWVEKHCRIGRYSLDIKKCNDHLCCKDIIETDFLSSLQPFNGFIPAPVQTRINRFTHVVETLSFTPANVEKFKLDLSCPSLVDSYEKFTCTDCGKYIPAVGLLKQHQKLVHKGKKQSKKGFDDFHVRPKIRLTFKGKDLGYQSD
jgi:hypothetical protein